MGKFLRPRSLDEALSALADEALTPFAGGTDLYPLRTQSDAWGQNNRSDFLDLSSVRELRGIKATEGGWQFGALTTWSDVVAADLPPLFDGLKAAAREVGGRQIQNRGTLGGNLCNASPAADGIPALLALDATVVLASRAGERRLPLPAFVTGNRQTERRLNELLTAIEIPSLQGEACSAFLKLGARRYLVISIAMAAVTLVRDARGTVAAARVAVGSCSAVAQRLPLVEASLRSQPLDGQLSARIDPRQFAPLSPITDIRADADYRAEAAVTLVRRAVAGLAGPARREAA